MQGIDHGEEFRRLHELYAQKSDDELSALANEIDSLTEMAQQVLRDEISRRGIDDQPPEVQIEDTVPKTGPSEDELVGVWAAEDSAEAEKIIGILESAGIPAWTQTQKAELPDGSVKDVEEIKVMVVAWRAALSLLAPFHPPEDKALEELSNKLPVCPKCHSSEIVFQGLDSEPTPAKTEKYNWACDACGHRWQDNGLEQLA